MSSLPIEIIHKIYKLTDLKYIVWYKDELFWKERIREDFQISRRLGFKSWRQSYIKYWQLQFDHQVKTVIVNPLTSIRNPFDPKVRFLQIKRLVNKAFTRREFVKLVGSLFRSTLVLHTKSQFPKEFDCLLPLFKKYAPIKASFLVKVIIHEWGKLKYVEDINDWLYVNLFPLPILKKLVEYLVLHNIYTVDIQVQPLKNLKFKDYNPSSRGVTNATFQQIASQLWFFIVHYNEIFTKK